MRIFFLCSFRMKTLKLVLLFILLHWKHYFWNTQNQEIANLEFVTVSSKIMCLSLIGCKELKCTNSTLCNGVLSSIVPPLLMVINFTPIQVSPSLLPPRSALDVLPQSLSAYPGSSTFFNQVIITVLSASRCFHS